MNSLSTILKQRRKALGLTLAQIADAMGVTEATVQRWESGNIKSVRYEKIAKLSNVLGVAPSTLMGWEPDDSGQLTPAVSSLKRITSAETRLLTLHRQLSEEGQARLLDYADDLVSSGKYERDERKPALIAARGDGSTLEGITSIDGDLSDHEDDLIP